MIILILWINFMWLIVLLGSSIAYYYQHAGTLQFLQRNTSLTPHNRDELAMQLMVLVTRRYYAGKSPLSIMKLSELLEMPDDLVEELVRNLIHGGFLIETDGHEKAVVPRRPPEETPASSLLRNLRNSSGEGDKGMRLHTDERVVAVLGTAESHAMNAIDDMNLKQLAGEERLISKKHIL